MSKTKIPKSVSKHMSEISRRRDPKKLREHLKKIASKGGKARWKERSTAL